MKVYSEKKATRNPVAHLDDLSENNFTLISDCLNVSHLVYAWQFNRNNSLPYVIVSMGPARTQRKWSRDSMPRWAKKRWLEPAKGGLGE